MGDSHHRWVIIDFAQVTKFNCGCYLFNAGDLACLRDHVDLAYKHTADAARNLCLGTLLCPLPFSLHFFLFSSTFLHAISLSLLPQIQLQDLGSYKSLSQRSPGQSPSCKRIFYAVWALRNVSHGNILGR